MPLVTINCKPGWRLPDIVGYNPAGETNPRLRAVYAIAYCVTHAAASAVNEVDGDEMLTPSEVLINFGQLHGAAFNADDIQIIVSPGTGDPTIARFDRLQARRRRVAIHDLIHAALVALIHDLAADEYEWPGLDLEVMAGGISGSNTAPDGTTRSTWGGVQKEPRPLAPTVVLPPEDRDATA